MRKLRDKLSSIFSIKHKVIMDKEIYAEHFWRGISNKDFISDGHVLYTAFQFDETDRTDKCRELSINWDDDEGAVKKLLEQKKDNGNIQFRGGATKLSLAAVKIILKQYIDSKQFSYERRIVEGNDYHGNLLVSADLSKQLRNQISNGLALVAGTYIIDQNNE